MPEKPQHTATAVEDGAEAFAEIEGAVRDPVSGEPIPCWVEAAGPDGAIVDDWRVTDDWRGFPCDGTFRLAGQPGTWTVRLRFRLGHEEVRQTLRLDPGETKRQAWTPNPWVTARAWGYVAGESHNHIPPDTPLDRVVRYARAFELRYINVAQPWLWNPDPAVKLPGAALAARLEAAGADGVALHFGAERPKTRYGHVWWVNLPPFEDPRGEYMGWHDSAYVAYVDRTPRYTDDLQRRCPLQAERPFETWRRYRRAGAACVAAHPTSWWLNRPDDEQVVTNISAELPFGLLSGTGPDALVVMGYDPDQVFYQNLWFHILNEGYLLAGAGETDGALRGRHHIGQIMMWTRLAEGETYSPPALAAALRAGRSVMSSGPFIRLTADAGRAETGDRMTADGAEHVLKIEAWSAPEAEEALTWVVVYRNGLPFEIRDLRAEPTRHTTFSLPVRETDYAWYAVKAYGCDGPSDAADLDVFACAERCERRRDTAYRARTQVALTNPIWFLPPGWTPPPPVVCRLDAAARPCPGATVEVSDDGQILFTAVTDAAGQFAGEAPPTAVLRIDAPGHPAIERSIFLDYRPVNACMEHTYSGQWRAEAPALDIGQVPWRAFRFQALRDALKHVDWTIRLPS